jgi:peptidoglycan hydrolase CwlO-like protein
VKASLPINETNADADLNEKLDALAKDRDLLRQEVSELRKSLEDIQGKHDQELEDVRSQLEEAETGKEQAETLHKNLKERVNTITATLGERMRANSVRILPINLIGATC